MLILTMHNISSDLSSEALQRRILANLQPALNHSHSNIIASQCALPPAATQNLPAAPTVSVSIKPSANPLAQISAVPVPQRPCQLPLSRQPLQPWQQIRHRLGPCTIVCSDCKALHWSEERSRKVTKHVPKFSTSCTDGTISLPQLSDTPILLEELLRDNSNS
jgi:hypothetical protein